MAYSQNRFTTRFKIKFPFVCAGMAFICEKPSLCAAVSKAGGMGAITASLLSPDELSTAIDAVRTITRNPFHINFLAIFPHDEHIKVCIAKQVAAVSFHWGNPSATTVKALKAAKIAIWSQVGSVDAARAAVKAGCDGVVAQGNEAGGHNYGGLPLMALVPLVRDVIGDKLLLAAGGIADGRGMAAALALGADGVWVGTRMVATTESNAHPEYRKRLVKASAEDTILSSVYGPENPGFNPMRMLKNETIAEWDSRIAQLPAKRDHLEPIGETLFAGQTIPVRPFDAFVTVPETTGDFDLMPLLSGQGVGLITAVEPAGIVVKRMCSEAAKRLKALSKTS
jgi:enoyl-[acyl-carrier protein] reductase II